MELIRGISNLRAHHRGCVLTIGNYDGVIGILTGLWFSSLAIVYYVRHEREMSAG